MRFFSGLAIFTLFTLSVVVAQTSNHLNAVRFVDANLVVAAGNAGTILRSNDGGSSWTNLPSGTTANVFGISFANGSVGVAVGARQSFLSFYPELLNTANGGSSWDLQGYTSVITDVKFLDAQKVLAVGYTGAILRSLNGGGTWTPLVSGVTDNLLGVDFIDGNNGIATGSWGRVVRTNNGGDSWTSYSSGTTNSLSAVDMVDANTAFAVGNGGLVYRTVNGGASWTQIQTPVTRNLSGVCFVDANNGWVVGWYGTILRTSNGGSSWTVQSSGTTNDLYDVSFRDANTGVAVGLSGVILRTTNGGATWAPPGGGGGGGNPPAAPTLASPSNGATGQPTTLTLSWNSSSGATSYRLQVSTASNFSTTVYDNSAISGTSQSVGGLSNTTLYYWRVNASNNDGTSAWSSVWSFTTTSGGSAPAAPALASPSNGATGQPTTLSLNWNASSGASTYRLQVSTSSDFTSTVYDNASITGTSQSVGGLANSTTHYWRVNATNSFGTSGWSSVWSFTTSAMTGVPDFAVSPTSLDFGAVPTKTTKTLPVMVSNPGSATLVVSSITSSSGFFTVSPTSLSLPPNGSQNVNITFKPKNKNLVTATITFNHNAPGSPGTVTVSGRGGGNVSSSSPFAGIPDEVILDQNYPNPFNPTTEIEFALPEDSRVKLTVYNMIGQEVATLVDEVLSRGYHGASWSATTNDGRTLPSGIYIYRLQTTTLSTGETVVRAGKMQLLK